MVEALRWRVTVSKLGDSRSEWTLEVGATNWVAALRAARLQLGQDGGVPQGASCAVDPEGIVTVLVPTSRQRFIVARTWPEQVTHEQEVTARVPTRASVPPLPEPQRTASQTIARAPRPAGDKTATDAPQPASNDPGRDRSLLPRFQRKGRRKRFETVAYVSDPNPRAKPSANPAPRPSRSSPPPTHAHAPGRGDDRQVPEPTTSSPGTHDHVAPAAQKTILRLITERNEDPSVDNPLTYRERAYAIAPGITLAEAEVALHKALAELQTQLTHVARGKFVNLAVFDHSWSDLPRRPPLVVLEWRDWRGEASIEYPIPDREPTLPGNEEAEAERLAQLFEALRDLPHMRSASAAMDLALELLSIAIPCEASAGCLYDINTDELRFVAVRGHHAIAQQGTAIRLGKGLISDVALREGEPITSTYRSPDTEKSFDPMYDARPGLPVRTLLLRPLRTQGQLVGILQLINRGGAEQSFTEGDINLANYVGTRLGDTLTALRASVSPATR